MVVVRTSKELNAFTVSESIAMASSMEEQEFQELLHRLQPISQLPSSLSVVWKGGRCHCHPLDGGHSVVCFTCCSCRPVCHTRTYRPNSSPHLAIIEGGVSCCKQQLPPVVS